MLSAVDLVRSVAACTLPKRSEYRSCCCKAQQAYDFDHVRGGLFLLALDFRLPLTQTCGRFTFVQDVCVHEGGNLFYFPPCVYFVI